MASPSSGSSAIKGAYWRSWVKDFPPSSIATKLFTHIYYAFLTPNNDTYKFKIDDETYGKLINFTSTLGAMKPPVKTLLSIGGANADPSLFSKMASTPSSRETFIESTIQVARKFRFDGIDFDWQFPETPNDMDNLSILLAEWRAAITTDASLNGKLQLLLSAATYFSAEFFLSDVKRIYPVKSVSENLDWINAMCYDYCGGWNKSMTGAHAALYDPKSKISTSDGLGSWIKAGLPSKKFVMGLPLYGHTWTLRDLALNGVRASAVALGPGNDGIMSYSEVEKFNAENNAKVVYDESTVSTYSVVEKTWIGYDDVNSIKVKILYAQEQQMGGYFFWAVNNDHKWKISETASELWKL